MTDFLKRENMSSLREVSHRFRNWGKSKPRKYRVTIFSQGKNKNKGGYRRRQ